MSVGLRRGPRRTAVLRARFTGRQAGGWDGPAGDKTAGGTGARSQLGASRRAASSSGSSRSERRGSCSSSRLPGRSSPKIEPRNGVSIAPGEARRGPWDTVIKPAAARGPSCVWGAAFEARRRSCACTGRAAAPAGLRLGCVSFRSGVCERHVCGLDQDRHLKQSNGQLWRRWGGTRCFQNLRFCPKQGLGSPSGAPRGAWGSPTRPKLSQIVGFGLGRRCG